MEHCEWCNNDIEPEPMVCGHEVPLICPNCGGHYWTWGHRELHEVLKGYRTHIKELEARHQCLIEMAQRIRRVAENDTTLKSYSCVQAMCDVLRDHEAILEGEGK